ncbi:uroporphyrinogen-III C-methyltransferase [Candidatus Haliotispira prima]|uniref:uroporphyrinogen-III C-methyltransferase n=1 Tax=Candidatus Haliotispira prima TaxID=3034016 RepID=A0ABY8ML67_9SPIO|nr:uroporphyrinogen-III C-methyltransferase [Candidatus Haliotispira prima]
MNEALSGTLLSRGSPLARAQLQEFLARLYGPGADPGSKRELHCRFIDSLGDKRKELSLLDGKAPDDFFTRELDREVLAGKADWALHSAKDLPRPLADGLEIRALLAPENLLETDSLLSQGKQRLEDLGPRARIGSSSPGRRRQILALRPDLEVVPLRGTIGERIARVERGELDAVIVATCALHRLGLDEGYILPFEVHPLQGYLAAVGRIEPGTSEPEAMAAALRRLDARQKWGAVTLLGAGAGDAGLLTLEGRRALGQADIVFYDALVNKDLLELAPPQAEKVYVGKRSGAHSMPQSRINGELWRAAREGKQVLRLKGGDALLFARAAEELQVLSEAGVSHRVLPGISAAFAAAASLALPLTQRGDEGASLHLLSAYPPERIDFHRLPPDGNIIFYMGLAQRREIQRRALEAGRRPEDPALVVLWASLPQQKNIYTTLGQLPQPEIEKKAAGLILLGPIARPPESCGRAAGSLPHELPELRGKTWITGLNPLMDRETPPELVWHLPLLELQSIPIAEPVKEDEAKADADKADAGEADALKGTELSAAVQRADLLLFTSKHAVRYFFAWLEQAKSRRELDFRLLGDKRIVSIGVATSRELEQFGLCLREPEDWQSPEESSVGLLREFARRGGTGLRGRHILIPSGNKALPTLTEGLPLEQNGGHSVERIILYKNVLNPVLRGPDSPLAFLRMMNEGDEEQEELCDTWDRSWEQLGRLKAVYLSSPSTADYFAELVAAPLQQRFGAGFPGWWEYRCKGEPTRRRLAELQAHFGMLRDRNRES